MRSAANPIPVLIAVAWGVLLAPSLLHAHGPFHDRVALVSSRIEAEPANAGPYLTRSILYRDHGDFAAALADLERGAQLDPMRRELDLLYGRLYIAWDQPERAVAPVGPENSCRHRKIVVMEPLNCRTLDNLVGFCQSNRSTVGRIPLQ